MDQQISNPIPSGSATICNGDISLIQQIVASSVGALTTSLMGKFLFF